jgi:NIMA (never in mitosis gene a)-related kinase 1/4/5
VFLTKGGIAKLGGFSISVVLGKGMMCSKQAGTPYYASPEVFRDQEYNSKSDMWSLGCILYEILHLKPAFRARDMAILSQKVNRGFYGKIDSKYS